MAFVHTSNKTENYKAGNRKYVQRHLKQQQESGSKSAVKVQEARVEAAIEKAHKTGVLE